MRLCACFVLVNNATDFRLVHSWRNVERGSRKITRMTIPWPGWKLNVEEWRITFPNPPTLELTPQLLIFVHTLRSCLSRVIRLLLLVFVSCCLVSSLHCTTHRLRLYRGQSDLQILLLLLLLRGYDWWCIPFRL